MRLRFAPSPTGLFHIGNFRTLIFNYLMAKFNNGLFNLRIDDTDIKRNTSESLSNIFLLLNIFEIKIDNINFQTTYINKILLFAKDLINDKLAYYCDCLEISNDCICSESDRKNEGAIFLNIKKIFEDNISYNDLIHGVISTPKNQIYNLLLVRKNGVPLYHFCTVVSDIIENNNFIIRGADHMSNTWKHIAIYSALNKEVPKYAHIPLIKNSSGAKLSKRSSDCVSITDLLKEGILVDTIINYCIRLGWGYKDFDVFNLDEIKEFFTIKNFKSSSCSFDYDKIISLNRHHLTKLTPENIHRNLSTYFSFNPEEYYSEIFSFASLNILSRYSTLKEFVKSCRVLTTNYEFNYEFNLTMSEKILGQLIVDESKLFPFDSFFIENIIQKGFSPKDVHGLIRFILTGKKDNLNTNILLEKITNKEILRRINKFSVYLENLNI